MDTLTHALSGALLARVTGRPYNRRGLSLSERTLTGFLAAGFPDLDYALYWFDPLDFLNWHRGPTHSLLLLPLWAWLLAIILSRLLGKRHPWRVFFGVCALGIGVHILGDVITLYGTKLFSPLINAPFGLGLVFDVDPYIAALVAVGFIGSLRARPPQVAGMTLLALGIYLLLQTLLHWQTATLGQAFKEQQGLQGSQVYALPQPFSPFMWKLIVSQEDRHYVTYLNYLAWETEASPENAWLPWRMLGAYRPANHLDWDVYHRFGATDEAQSLARQAWRQDRFAAFRQFAVLPVLYRIDRSDGEVCVWFTDLRHTLPVLPPPFRYGLCRTGPEADWYLYRLRYFTLDARQSLGVFSLLPSLHHLQ